MKNFTFILVFVLASFLTNAQQAPFITTWEVNQDDLSITIPVEDNLTYDYTIDFGDGTIVNNVTGSITHEYFSYGVYTVTISGIFPRIFFATFSQNESEKLKTIEQWGDIQWSSMSGAFAGCVNMTYNATDVPDLSQVTHIGGMFRSCHNFNGNINNWDVSNITKTGSMFAGAQSFNQPLDNWDVSQVIHLGGMFGGSAFNQDISSWNFNSNVDLNDPNVPFVSSFDPTNYDLLLNRFVELNLQDKYFRTSTSVKYCNFYDRETLAEDLGWWFEDGGVSDNCQMNLISGNVTYDNGNDGCDPQDNAVGLGMVSAVSDDFSFWALIGEEGEYNLGTFDGDFQIEIQNLPSYFEVSPATTSQNFVGLNNNVQQDFCLTTDQSIQDLKVTVLPPSVAIPGFDSNYKIVVENLGTHTATNTVLTFEFDDSYQSFVISTPTETASTSNSVDFNIQNLQPFSSTSFEITLQNETPPTLYGGEVLQLTAQLPVTSAENTPNDNEYTLNQTVVNSYDPNDKRVLQGEEIYLEETDEYLDYIIRFQNNGTANAEFVRIRETLHPNLDWTTFQPISSSHDYRVEITDGDRVEYIFDNIDLAYEAADEPASHGYIAYRIKPKTNTQLGDVFTGDAKIYFDYNPPIITNSTYTEVVENLSINRYDLKNQLQVYPNPSQGILHISSDTVQIEKVSVYNLQGRKLTEFNQNFENLSIENLSKGLYLLQIVTEKGNYHQKLIKN